MDKLMDTPWFIKILALLLAVLLYSSVPHAGKDVYVPGEQTSETIKDIPVKIYYDTENLVVTGVPYTVDVDLKGPITHIQSAKALRNFEVYVDLTNAKIGRQKVNLKVKDLSDKLQASIKPNSVYVTIQEKIAKEFKVEAEYNPGQIEDGYAAGTPAVEPKRVKITGAKSEIDRITYVKAVIEEKEKLKETTTKTARIQVLDKDLNKLDVTVEPETVKVTLPIKETAKTVPINIVRKGSPPSGVTIESIDLDTAEAVITGDEDILKNTESVRVEMDVSKINDNTTLDLPVIISNGISKVTPQMVKATVKVSKQAETTVSGVPLKIKGLGPNLKADITDPANKVINLIVNGPSTALSGLRPEDFNAYVDLSSLPEGNHEVNIHIDGPPNVNYKPDKSTAKITITNNA
ncbi:CdaR family protein [Neobacillus rhizophilus]|uniref:YbbR-like domain-containing protein n=1 Tax=Neobacillus rhizophilus TaxID=2833579 RepID=A0A942UCC3_9BACI|nr:CdaR family protein [Neobacillus rhizophilus]MBS4216458.1 YbbR-like domain-containing protein [Neobacillus rhizophilus]